MPRMIFATLALARIARAALDHGRKVSGADLGISGGFEVREVHAFRGSGMAECTSLEVSDSLRLYYCGSQANGSNIDGCKILQGSTLQLHRSHNFNVCGFVASNFPTK